MSLIGLVLIIAIVGLLCWIILQIPMPVVFRNICLAVMVLGLILWLMQALGIATGLPQVRLK